LRLYCATTNTGKLREFRMAGEQRGIGIEPVPGLERIAPFEEAALSFEQNAVEKAVYYSGFAPGAVFADDSGLEVEALGGDPGVLSARFAGENATDEENNRLLLERLQGVTGRHARFVCVIAVARAGEVLRIFRGAVEGRILEAPRGSNGFGYDPLFLYPPFGRTFGELTDEKKMRVSHRSQALRAMLDWYSDAPLAG